MFDRPGAVCLDQELVASLIADLLGFEVDDEAGVA